MSQRAHSRSCEKTEFQRGASPATTVSPERWLHENICGGRSNEILRDGRIVRDFLDMATDRGEKLNHVIARRNDLHPSSMSMVA
jgi:hypothetical protein